MPSNLDLLDAPYRSHGREYGYLDFDGLEFAFGERFEARILEGGRAGHAQNGIVEAVPRLHAADATAQISRLFQGDEGSRGNERPVGGFRARIVLLAGSDGGLHARAGESEQILFSFLVEGHGIPPSIIGERGVYDGILAL